MLNKTKKTKSKKLIKSGERNAVEVTYEAETVTPPTDIFVIENFDELIPIAQENVARAQARLDEEQAILDDIKESKALLA